VQYEPVMSDCDCDAASMKDNGECVQKDTIPKNNMSLCICNYDRQDSTAWPCFSAKYVAKLLAVRNAAISAAHGLTRCARNA
jgi:hypothetical protein